MIKKCEVCGAEYQSVYTNTKYCPDCRIDVKREQDRQHEKRRGNALERKRVAERVAEYDFDEFDGALRIVTVEARRVPFGDYAV